MQKQVFTLNKSCRPQNLTDFEMANNNLFHSHNKCLRLFNKKIYSNLLLEWRLL